MSLISEARERNGFVVDFDNNIHDCFMKGGQVNVPEEIRTLHVSCKSILDTLSRDGIISNATYNSAIESLSINESTEIFNLPNRKSFLIFRFNTIDVMAATGILDVVCDEFNVYIENENFKRILRELHQIKSKQDEVEWLREIINKIKAQIKAGIYSIIPITSLQQNENIAGAENPELAYLISIMGAKPVENALICMDDRFITGHAYIETIPVISSYEILGMLLTNNVISQEEYYQILIRMRASGYCFLPLGYDELTYNLKKITTEQNWKENYELITLRKYVALTLHQINILQEPKIDEFSVNSRGESEYIFQINQAVCRTIIELWQLDQKPSILHLQLEWLLKNIYLEPFVLSEYSNWEMLKNNSNNILALNLIRFVVFSSEFSLELLKKRPELRSEYFRWVYYRILLPKFDNNPQLLILFIDYLKNNIFRKLLNIHTDFPQELVINFQQNIYFDLPKAIQKELRKDHQFMEELGILSVIQLGRDQFHIEELFTAMKKAIEGEEICVISISNQEFVLRMSNDDEISGKFYLENKKGQLIVEDEIFLVLSKSIKKRNDCLRRNRFWFDCNNNKFEKLLSKAVLIEGDYARINFVEGIRQSSLVMVYSNIERNFIQSSQIRLDDLRPIDVNAFSNHYRLPEDIVEGKITNLLKISYQILADEVGIEEAIKRLIRMPVPLPETVISDFRKLEISDRGTIINEVWREAISPLNKIHLIHLFYDDLSIIESQKSELIFLQELLQTADEDFDLYFSILNWVNTEFIKCSHTNNLPSRIRLLFAWSHADKIYSILKSHNQIDAKGILLFTENSNQLLVEALNTDRTLFFDVSTPIHLSKERLISSGLQYALEGKVITFSEFEKELFKRFSFSKVGEKYFPSPYLLTDFSQSTNVLQSFLGDPIQKIINEIFNGMLEIPEEDSLEIEILKTIEKLSQESDLEVGWLLLHYYFGNNPIGKKFVKDLTRLINKSDLVDLTRKNPSLGISSINIASSFASKLINEILIEKTQEELLEVVANINIEDHEENSDVIIDVLFDSAFSLTKKAKGSLEEFGDFIYKMVQRCPYLAQKAKNILQNMFETLPYSMTKGLAKTIISLRVW